MLFDSDLLNEIRDILLKRKESVAVAESVTSGFLQVAFGAADNASLFYQGGITAYNLGQKARHLSVNPIHALETDCVSETIAAQMALNVAKLFSSDYGIGITGYATRIPEKNVNKLFAFFAVAYRNKIVTTQRLESDKSEGQLTQLYYAEKAIKRFQQLLQKEVIHSGI